MTSDTYLTPPEAAVYLHSSISTLEHFPLDVNRNDDGGLRRGRKSDSGSASIVAGARWRRDTRTIFGLGWSVWSRQARAGEKRHVCSILAFRLRSAGSNAGRTREASRRSLVPAIAARRSRRISGGCSTSSLRSPT